MTIKAGLIGSPLKRSLSPRLFKLFTSLSVAKLNGSVVDPSGPGEKYSYVLLETRAAGLGRALSAIKRGGWAGFNVTLPLKEKILPFLDALSPEAGAVGAVNAVRLRNGKMKGYNTDAAALQLSLKEAGCRLRGRACVVWGAGGAARTAAWVLGRGGAASVHIHNRTPSRAAALAKYFLKMFPRTAFSARKFTAAPAAAATVFINATPLGMYAPLPACLKLSGPPGSFYMDLAYTRGISPFLNGRDGKIVSGLDLLIYQALKSAELFGGRPIKAAKIVELKDRFKAKLLLGK